MYVPPAFTMTELEALEVVRNVGVGYFVTAYKGNIQSTFLPFIVQSSPDGVRIWAHFAKANSHWKAVGDAPDCLLIVHLADAYVSPSLYPSKQVDGKVVPTWNYVTVEVRGTLKTCQTQMKKRSSARSPTCMSITRLNHGLFQMLQVSSSMLNERRLSASN